MRVENKLIKNIRRIPSDIREADSLTIFVRAVFSHEIILFAETLLSIFIKFIEV